MSSPPAIRRIQPFAAGVDERIHAIDVQLVECIDPVRDDIEWFPQAVELYDEAGEILDVGNVSQLEHLASLAWDIVEQRTGRDRHDGPYRVQIRPAVLVRDVSLGTVQQ